MVGAELSAISDSQARLAYVVERGGQQSPFPEAQRTESNRVEGCLARLWLTCEIRAGHCQFACDSDSAVVKGIAVLLCEFYSGQAPAEVVSVEPLFLSEAGLARHLSGNRRNALTRVRETIRAFALQHLPVTNPPR